MITKKKKTVWNTPDGKEHESLEAAQSHQLGELFKTFAGRTIPPEELADKIIENGEQVVSILTMKERKKRETKPAPVPAAGKKKKTAADKAAVQLATGIV